MAAHVVPEIPDWVDPGRLGRQEQNHDLFGHVMPARLVPARPVHDRDDQIVGVNLAGEDVQERAHGAGVDARCDQSRVEARCRLDRLVQMGGARNQLRIQRNLHNPPNKNDNAHQEVGAAVNIVKDSWGAFGRTLPNRLSASGADESVLTDSLRVSPRGESKEIP